MIRNNKTYVLHVLLSSFYLLAFFHTMNEWGRRLTCSYYKLFMYFSIHPSAPLHTGLRGWCERVWSHSHVHRHVLSVNQLMFAAPTPWYASEVPFWCLLSRSGGIALKAQILVTCQMISLIMRVSAEKRDKWYLKESLPIIYKSIMFFLFFFTFMCKPINHLYYATLLIS